MHVKSIFEFVVWDNCNNNCVFCWLKQHYNYANDTQKLLALDKVLDFILSEKFIKSSHVLIVGGEIFDSNNDKISSDIISFFKKLIDLLQENIIDLLYINTNLIYDITKILIPVLKMVDKKKLFNKLKFTTSWDIYGRFNNTEMLWNNNILALKKLFPNLNIVINTIITLQLCTAILQQKKLLISENIDCYVNYLPYIDTNSILTPSKDEVFKFLLHVNSIHTNYLKLYVDNFSLPLNKIVYKFVNDEFINYSSLKSNCDHSINFKRYSNDNTCFICDIKKLLDFLYE